MESIKLIDLTILKDCLKLLIKTIESYTNGGLILIKEKLEENPNYFLQPASFLDMILEIEKS
jgi:hypothetical protein